MANVLKSVVALLAVFYNMMKNRILTVGEGMYSSYFRCERGQDDLSF